MGMLKDQCTQVALEAYWLTPFVADSLRLLANVPVYALLPCTW